MDEERIHLVSFLNDLVDWISGRTNGDEGVTIRNWDEFKKAMADHEGHSYLEPSCPFCWHENS